MSNDIENLSNFLRSFYLEIEMIETIDDLKNLEGSIVELGRLIEKAIESSPDVKQLVDMVEPAYNSLAEYYNEVRG